MLIAHWRIRRHTHRHRTRDTDKSYSFTKNALFAPHQTKNVAKWGQTVMNALNFLGKYFCHVQAMRNDAPQSMQ